MAGYYCNVSQAVIISVIFLVMITFLPPTVAAEVMGIDKEPDLESTVIASVEHTTPSLDLDTWSLNATLAEAAVANGTTLELTTQICINSGVCYAPTPQNMTTADGVNWSGSVDTPADHAYVNWRITAYFTEDEQVVPDTGWAKTWSTCWVSFDAEGQPVSGGDGCVEKIEEESEQLSAMTVLSTLSMLAAAGLSRRQSTC